MTLEMLLSCTTCGQDQAIDVPVYPCPNGCCLNVSKREPDIARWWQVHLTPYVFQVLS